MGVARTVEGCAVCGVRCGGDARAGGVDRGGG